MIEPLTTDVPGLAAAIALAGWVFLFLNRGGFWRADQRLPNQEVDSEASLPEGKRWPAVLAIVPARNEAGTIAAGVTSLLRMEYPGTFYVVMVDDHSEDGTTEIARNAAKAAVSSIPFTTVEAEPLPPGWSGKLWAMESALRSSNVIAPAVKYLFFTDADIGHDPSGLQCLVAKAEEDDLALTSLMVKLRCESRWERLLIPAFVFFFQKLYPFAWVNDRNRRVAAAAGGCMLVHRETFEAAGGLEAIRDRLIDDCALAALLKPRAPIWLGLDERTASLRAYENLGEVWDMVARTAFVQLRHSFVLLLGTVIGMAVLYLAPPLCLLAGLASGDGATAAMGGAAWALMAALYWPTLKLYNQPAWAALALPLAAFLYTLMTLDSARRHWRNTPGQWKGRRY